MKVEVEAIEGCKRRLAVEAPADVVQQEWERAYVRVQKQARLPGSRRAYGRRAPASRPSADAVRREAAEPPIPAACRGPRPGPPPGPLHQPGPPPVAADSG